MIGANTKCATMKKYYTPEIEEFHVGFEFEAKTSNDTWVKTAFNNLRLINQMVDVLIKEEVRVKYLDRGDIESLGFKHSHHSTSYTNYFEKDNIEISVDSKSKRLRVKRLFKISNDLLFKGTIKNKSELKKLLKQLGI